MNKEISKQIPVMFQTLKEYEISDTRFVKTKIWLMHLEENYNGSYFSKESVIGAIPTLANTPILCYMEENSMGENDFSDHRMVLTKEKDGYSYKYIGQAIGVIPENNNAHFETRLCDDGKEREFLVVNGLIWTKWKDPIDIFKNQSIKNQSMELHEDYHGVWKDDGLFHFEKFSFFGACALGEDVRPAMESATIEAQFSQNNIFKEIQSKLEEFKKFSLNEIGGEILEEIKEVTEETPMVEVEEENTVELEAEAVEEVVEEAETVEEEAAEVEAETLEEVSEVAEETEVVEEVDYQAMVLELTDKLQEIQKEYATLSEEIEELRNFKAIKLAEERKVAEDKLFEKYSCLSQNEEYLTLRENVSKFELSDLEKELALIYAKQTLEAANKNFSKRETTETLKVPIDVHHEEEHSVYGGLFEKYLNK